MNSAGSVAPRSDRELYQGVVQAARGDLSELEILEKDEALYKSYAGREGVGAVATATIGGRELGSGSFNYAGWLEGAAGTYGRRGDGLFAA